MAKYNKEQFVNKSKEVHNDVYNYDDFIYINSKTKGIIKCIHHGDFLQTPANHMRGQKCPKCRKDYISYEDFISRSNKIHNNKYDYSLVDFINTSKKIKIICPVHGIFEQTANKHFYGGCKKCAGNHNYNNDEFIRLAKIAHNNKYDYSNTSYKNMRTKIKITCKLHGDFLQTPNGHLSGRGCKKCNMIGGYSFNRFKNDPKLKNKLGILYLIEIKDDGNVYYKLGITSKTIYKRFLHKNYKNISYSTLLTSKGNLYEMFCLEQHILKHYISKLEKPISNFYGGASECFKASQKYLNDLIAFICSSISFLLVDRL